MKPEISVIIPAYNEADNFKSNRLEALFSYLHQHHPSFELIFVNDGSKDETLHLLTQFQHGKAEVKVVDSPHQGKAGTVRTGMLVALGKYRLFTDFDQSTPIEEIAKLLPFFNRGYDIVIGSREVEGAAREKEPWYRHLMGKGFNFAVQLLAVRGIHDTQCGFKMMTQKAAETLFPMLRATVEPKKDAFTGAFDVELLFLARKNKFRTAEVPVQWHHVKSKRVNPIKDSVRMFWQILLIRWTYFTNRYA